MLIPCKAHKKYKGVGQLKRKCCTCWSLYESIHGQKKAISAMIKLDFKYPNVGWS